MEDNEQPDGPRVIVRTSQACQRCRSLKTRCLPSAQPGSCQRCAGAGKDCVWAEMPRRARKLRAPSRIAQVEQKIDGLVASLVHPSTSRQSHASPSVEAQEEVASTAPTQSRLEIWHQNRTVAPGSWMDVPLSFEKADEQPGHGIEQASDAVEADRQFLEKIKTIHSFGDREDMPHAPEGMFQPSKRREAPIKNAVVEELLTSGEADNLLNEYRQMTVSFPFVILPSGMTAQELHESKPMLLLAVITAASWRDHRRQMSLDRLFRSELANRTLIRPRRTLGLVQSVLVYLSWYHFVFSHKTQQIFFLHHLVIGLALDIGLHQEYQPINFPHRPPPPPPASQDLRERQRAFLGCYYLASMIAAGLQKPNLLRHTPHMAEWAQSLKKNREYESDETISHLIALRQIDDQIQDTLFTSSAVNLPLSDARTLMHVRFMESQIENWKKESCDAASQRLLALSSSFTTMQLHSVALRKTHPSDYTTTDSTQLNSLLSALEAGKQFLDALLSFPASEYHLISFSEWMRLPTVIMTVARLCMPTDAHIAAGWDFKAAQERVRLDLCLESICYRMQTLSTYDKRKQPLVDFWHAMCFINDLTKTWYIRRIRPKKDVGSSSQATPNDAAGNTMSEMSGPSSGALPTPCMHASSDQFAPFGGFNHETELNMDLSAELDDGPFAWMKNADFDMEAFFDMGIWGDESYLGMGFGNGATPF